MCPHQWPVGDFSDWCQLELVIDLAHMTLDGLRHNVERLRDFLGTHACQEMPQYLPLAAGESEGLHSFFKDALPFRMENDPIILWEVLPAFLQVLRYEVGACRLLLRE